jgi:hypothetical protein
MASKTTGPQQLLDLDDIVQRRKVRIGGKDYELLNEGELSIMDYRRLGRRWQEFEDIAKKDDATEEECSRADELLDIITRMTLTAPEDVHQSLTPAQRYTIGTFFMGLLKTTPSAQGETPATPEGEAPAAPIDAAAEPTSPTGAS